MNKKRIVSVILIVLMVSSIAVHCMWKRTKNYVSTLPLTKQDAIAQFDESVSRFKRCMRGKCSKIEALKATRDVSATALAAISVIYIARKALEAQAMHPSLQTSKVKSLPPLPEKNWIYRSNQDPNIKYKVIDIEYVALENKNYVKIAPIDPPVPNTFIRVSLENFDTNYTLDTESIDPEAIPIPLVGSIHTLNQEPQREYQVIAINLDKHQITIQEIKKPFPTDPITLYFKAFNQLTTPIAKNSDSGE